MDMTSFDHTTHSGPMPRLRRVAANVFKGVGRIWLLAIAIAIIVAGAAGHRQDGLTAAIVTFGAYSIALVIRLMSGPATGATR
jgi:hypothetical protein